jgi:hypothetical protein
VVIEVDDVLALKGVRVWLGSDRLDAGQQGTGPLVVMGERFVVITSLG